MMDFVVDGVPSKEASAPELPAMRCAPGCFVQLKLSKCEFHTGRVAFLGHIVSRNGLGPDSTKIESIKGLPEPKNVKDVQSFLGSAKCYRKLLQGFSRLARRLTEIMKKAIGFRWDKICKKPSKELTASNLYLQRRDGSNTRGSFIESGLGLGLSRILIEPTLASYRSLTPVSTCLRQAAIADYSGILALLRPCRPL